MPILSRFAVPAVIAVAVGVSGIAAVLYLYFKKDGSDSSAKRQTTTRTQQRILEMKIPDKFVGPVIGRGGENIKEVERKSETRINFKDKPASDGSRIIVIRGRPADVTLAEVLIKKTIADQPIIETLEMWIPHKACGRIIGKQGINIKYIRSISKATIDVGSSMEITQDGLQRLTIKGTAAQIQSAKSLINEKINEDEVRAKEDLERKEFLKSNNLNLRQNNKDNTSGEGDTSKVQRPANKPAKASEAGHSSGLPLVDVLQEELVSSKVTGFADVMVSSFESLSLFWVQMTGKNATEVDKLVEEMTRFYNQEGNRTENRITIVKEGDFVASPFPDDDCWYRGRIMEVTSSPSGEQSVSVLFVDFGDNACWDMSKLCVLLPQFRTLKAQAIECCLHGVKPSDKWDETAVQEFDRLALVAKWKVIICKPIHQKTRLGSTGGRSIDTASTRTVNCVQLINTHTKEDIDIGETLVSKGYATRIECGGVPNSNQED